MLTINEARTLANIADRAANITADYHANIYGDTVKVVRSDEPTRSYTVKDGVCECKSFTNYGTCKHSLGIVALVDAEVARMENLLRVMDDANIRQAIANGREIAEAARCEMSLELYRECIARAEAVAA